MDPWLALLRTPGADGIRHLPGGRSVFVKTRADAPAGYFAAEARGLAALADTGALRVPAVLAVCRRGIVLDDLGSGKPSLAAWERAGKGLAKLHQTCARRFGFPKAGWCGLSPQDNRPELDGFRFFAEQRLMVQARRAFDRRLLDRRALGQVESVTRRLPDWVPAQPPVLVHGDLWTGNLHACSDGELALIDAGAAHYGWAETDLAMLTLFGSPPPAFFSTYEAASGCDPDWRRRSPLYNLYHLLNHLNLFGPGYAPAVSAILDNYR